MVGTAEGGAERAVRRWVDAAGGRLVLDGGLATELEANGADLNDPLWSAKCLLSSPHLIRKASPPARPPATLLNPHSSYEAPFGRRPVLSPTGKLLGAFWRSVGLDLRPLFFDFEPGRTQARGDAAVLPALFFYLPPLFVPSIFGTVN